MRLLSFSVDRHFSFGVVKDGGIVDLGHRLNGVKDLGELLIQHRLDDARALVAEHDVDHELSGIRFERTIPWPGKIFCIGVNYGGRNAEYGANSADASYPSVFVRYPSSLTGHDRDLVRPPESEQLDYEGEIVAVIGKGGRRIPAGRALEHLAGLTLGNEGTIRDWVRHAKFNVTQGKNWESSGAMGPWMVTMDEVDDVDALHITTKVNGELRQDDTTASMKYPIAFQIEYLSTFCTLEPGDVIYTGTPTGAGARFEPPRWLEPGDVVEVSVPQIGTLCNGVRDERQSA